VYKHTIQEIQIIIFFSKLVYHVIVKTRHWYERIEWCIVKFEMYMELGT
jgi:hypothetical protein